MKRVKFICFGVNGEEIFGKLVDNEGNSLTASGWWRTTDKVEAAKRAIISAELSINEVSLEIN